MIHIIYYGAGNIRSVSKAIEAVGAQVKITENPKDIEKADKIVLPGVGAFGKAVEALKARNLIEPIQSAITDKKPFLGICLGMQLLFAESDENPEICGLSVLEGRVNRFPPGLKVPHLGWNQVRQATPSPLWKGVPDESFFYFAHSFYTAPDNDRVTAGITAYPFEYTSSVWQDMLFGVQFHPEKSQKWGLKILENFVKI
jgi:glutamine amidotransferase